MSASADLQDAIIELLGQAGALRVNVPVLKRLPFELASDIDAAAAVQKGLCIHVEPPLPTRAESMQGGPIVFFDSADLNVVIVELPALNSYGATAWDLMDDVIAYLHWQPKAEGGKLNAILAHPLQLAPRPVDANEGLAQDPAIKDRHARIIGIHFNATYGFVPS